MEKEISEDSYCTTEEGDEEDIEGGYESDVEFVNPDYVGMSEKIKNENIFKEILEIGIGKEKPSEIDNVIISTIAYIKYSEKHIDHFSSEEEIIKIPEFNFVEKEFNLDSHFEDLNVNNTQEEVNLPLPKALVLAIQTMRKNEKAKVFIKPNYIFKHFDKLKKHFPNLKINEKFYDEYLRNKMKNQKIIFEVILHNFYVIQNLMDRGEIRKKIIKNGTQWKYARNPDFIYYNLSCHYGDKIIYNYENMFSELDTNLQNKKIKLFEIEKRILQNVKIGELSEISVKPIYMHDKNSEFLKHYNIDNKINTKFICEVFKIETYDYIYKPDRDNFSKKRILLKGIGRDSPDRESLVKLKFLLKVDDKILYNNLEFENIEDYIKNTNNISNFVEFREKMNQDFNINQLDEEENYERDSKIFSLVDQKISNLTKIDLRLYSIPIVMRKVLIHMKRNEICYLRTNYLDYLKCDNLEIIKLNNTKIEIFIHLFEFLHRPLFSKLGYDNKLQELSEMKDLANQYFKEGNFFRACKIYQNINYRFNYGEVFNSHNETFVEKEKELEKENKILYDKLVVIRLSCHNNLASAKFKLGNYRSVYEITNKIIKDLDENNLKANYLHGKSCLELKLYDEAIETFRKLVLLSPENEEFKNSLKEAENMLNLNLKKQKNLYKKMIFSNEN